MKKWGVSPCWKTKLLSKTPISVKLQARVLFVSPWIIQLYGSSSAITTWENEHSRKNRSLNLELNALFYISLAPISRHISLSSPVSPHCHLPSPCIFKGSDEPYTLTGWSRGDDDDDDDADVWSEGAGFLKKKTATPAPPHHKLLRSEEQRRSYQLV